MTCYYVRCNACTIPLELQITFSKSSLVATFAGGSRHKTYSPTNPFPFSDLFSVGRPPICLLQQTLPDLYLAHCRDVSELISTYRPLNNGRLKRTRLNHLIDATAFYWLYANTRATSIVYFCLIWFKVIDKSDCESITPFSNLHAKKIGHHLTPNGY